MKHLLFVFLLLILVNCTKEKKSLDNEARTSPNIIYIMADDLGYGDLGCYGQDSILTPNIDRLASEGILFKRHYAGATVCAPSRSTLMTGLHTGHTRIRGNKSGMSLAETDTTVAELLQAAGYKTGLIGKWGLGDAGSVGIPNKKGFDYFYGFLNQIRAHNYYPEFLWKNTEEVLLKNKVTLIDSTYAKGLGGVATHKEDYVQDLFTQEALRFVDRNKGNPFFLYLAYTPPHANNQYFIGEEHGMEVPNTGIYANKNWPEPVKSYAAMVSRLDADIGQLLEKLKTEGLDENTIVIFTSDNGPHAEGKNDPAFFNSAGGLRGIKRDLYEGGIRIPMIVRWPNRIKAGSSTDHVSAFWDFLPTACDLAGVPPTKNTDGISYKNTLFGKAQEKHAYLYWEHYDWTGVKQAVLMDSWKGVRLGTDKKSDSLISVYNLKADEEEMHDVSQSNSEITKKLNGYLQTAHTFSADFHWSAEKKVVQQ